MDSITVEQVVDYRTAYRGPQRLIEHLISVDGYGEQHGNL